MDEMNQVLHQLDTRLSVVERDLVKIFDQDTKRNRWLMALVILAIGYIVTGVVGFTRLQHTVEQMDVAVIQQNVATALEVLKLHRASISNIETEQQRIRGAHDMFRSQIESVRGEINVKTQDRWYRADGMENRRRIERIEDEIMGDR